MGLGPTQGDENRLKGPTQIWAFSPWVFRFPR